MQKIVPKIDQSVESNRDARINGRPGLASVCALSLKKSCEISKRWRRLHLPVYSQCID